MADEVFGCSHLRDGNEAGERRLVAAGCKKAQELLNQDRQGFLSSQKGGPMTLQPTYICVECLAVNTFRGAGLHYKSKRHLFAIETRSGRIFCHKCRDFVYDTVLEEIITATMDSLSSPSKKRKASTEGLEIKDLSGLDSDFKTLPCEAIGLKGIHNMGQTCFMSVILQALIHNPLMRNYYLRDGHRADGCYKENCIGCAVDEMYAEFYTDENKECFSASALLIRSWLATQTLAGYKQQDCHEYLQFLLDQLHHASEHEENGRQSCGCIIHTVFYGKLRSRVTCDECKNTTTTVDPMMDLNLDLQSQAKKQKIESKGPTKLDLRSCLSWYTKPEKLQYVCQTCGGGLQSATKQLKIKQLPPVLCIQLKRFEHLSSGSVKIDIELEFPSRLNMGPYTTGWKKGESQTMQDLSRKCTYELSAVIVHKGKIDSGHYVVFCRVGEKWFLFDDSKVTIAKQSEVMAAKAYLLFYTIRSLR